MTGLDFYPINPTTWVSNGPPIRNYSSLIWTERYTAHSDFELNTYDVEATIAAIPPETLVSVRGSKEVMMVEEHHLKVDEKGNEVLTVTGRSLTLFVDERVIGEKRDQVFEAMNSTSLGSVIILLYNSFVNTQAYDILTRKNAYYKNPKDAIPNVVISDSTGEMRAGLAGTSGVRYLEPGYLTEPLAAFLSYRPYGLRVVRPPYNTWVAAVSNSAVITGVERETTELCFDIYKGTDRSVQQNAVRPVILDFELKDLTSANFITGVEKFKNEVHIALDDKAVFARSDDTLSGLKRRVLYVDPGQVEEGHTPTTWEQHNVNVANELLKAHRKVVIADGEVSPNARLQMNRDYFLGDIISVRGQGKDWSQARVTEFIISDDENGVLSYPSLVTL